MAEEKYDYDAISRVYQDAHDLEFSSAEKGDRNYRLATELTSRLVKDIQDKRLNLERTLTNPNIFNGLNKKQVRNLRGDILKEWEYLDSLCHDYQILNGVEYESRREMTDNVDLFLEHVNKFLDARKED
ncbi:MAG: hypothetical protein WC438_02765 [Candidatus Pacearchaeota archaeon]